MKLISHIDHKLVTGKEANILEKEFLFRQSVRVVIFNNRNKIALIHSGKYDSYKLPGGGIEQDETILQAINREALEETGCEIKIIKELGLVTELRTDFKFFDKGLFQISYCYTAELIKQGSQTQYTNSENKQKMSMVWMDFNNAFEKMSKASPSNYNQNFIHKRDFDILKATKNIMNIK